MASLSDAEIGEMKKAFKKADKQGNNSVNLADLAQVFQELDDWSAADLHDLFDAAGGHGENKLQIHNFIDWVMQEDTQEGDAPMPGIPEEDDDDEDDEQGQLLALKAPMPEPTMDMSIELSYEEWMMLSKVMDVDFHEANDSYEHFLVQKHSEQCHNCGTKYMHDSKFCRNCGAKRQEKADIKIDHRFKVPIKAFADDHGIHLADAESMHHLEELLDMARKKLAAGERHSDSGSSLALPIAVEQVNRVLAQEQLSQESAYDLVKNRKVCLSNAGRKAIEAYKDQLVTQVKAAKVNPPLLPSRAGRQGNREHCIEELRLIIEQCKRDGKKFTDTEWDVLKSPHKVLYVDGEKPGYDCTVAQPHAWKRITELFETPVLFKGGARPADIVQGRLGTCFFLGALGAMVANDPEFVKSCFMEHDIQLGIYGVRFSLDGEWYHTIIDDYMPVDQYGRLLYAKGHDRDEVWVPLLEKAFCKFHTCYEMCDGGFPGEAVAAMCGGCKGKFPISKKSRSDPATPPTYFKALKNARDRGWILSTTFTQTRTQIGVKTGQGKNGEDVLSSGLVRGHVYSVLKLVEAGGNRLVCCRNPWGQGEWKGKWSDENRFGEWTQEMKAATKYEGGNDGLFWMSIEDFVATSGGVNYSRHFGSRWKKISQYAHFQASEMKATALWPYKAASDDELTLKKGDKITVDKIAPGWWHGSLGDKSGFFPGNYIKLDDRPVAAFDLDAEEHTDSKETMTAVVQIIQPLAHRKRVFHRRKQDGLNYKDTSYPKMMLIVVGPDGKTILKKSGAKREINGEIQLHGGKGKWKVYAMSMAGGGGQFIVRCYIRDGNATLTDAPDAHMTDLASIVAA